MKVTVKAADPAGLKIPALLVFLFSEDQPDLSARPELAGFKPLIAPRLESKDFQADHLNTLTLFPEARPGPERVILAGLGPEKELTSAKLRAAAAKAAQTARDHGLAAAALLAPPARGPLADTAETAEHAVLGAFLGLQQFNELKTEAKEKKAPLKSLLVLPAETRARSETEAAARAAEILAEAVRRARDLGNRPANLLYPETLAEEARKLAKSAGLKIKVLDQNQARRRGMGAFLAVAQGSHRPGRVIILEYKGGAPKERPVVLVGKAITFDSGGLSLKPSEGLHNMKTDMAGGAAVLAVLAAAAGLKLKLNLVGIVPAAENMPDGGAYRPGDILTSMSGQTIEVISTDAEGRLILADALTLAREYTPYRLIDIATLTGACVVALGEKCAGLMGTSPELIADLKNASVRSGERVWEMPLIDDYYELLKSETADFKNAGARYGGAITGALFLKKFVGDAPWAHLDIAGPSRLEKAEPDTPAGATGFGVLLLSTFLRDLAP
ncbi:MAG: leucyl aminopeptidase [Thermodesulfobacteriota bacterium]